MKKEELDEIINKLEWSNSTAEAYIAMHQFGGGPEESFAKANKQGLELFAARLLKASRDIDDIADKEEKYILLDWEEEWIDGDIIIQHIEVTDKGREEAKKDYKSTLSDKLIPIGCIVVLLVMLISTVVGLITIGKFLF